MTKHRNDGNGKGENASHGAVPKHAPAPQPRVLETATVRLIVGSDTLDAVLAAAREVLADGGAVVFPTETYYGLAVRPDDDEAVAHLAAIKGRASAKPIPLIAGSRADAERVGAIPPALEPLVRHFWPGPLTVALEPVAAWPRPIVGDVGTVGVRVPGHDLARMLGCVAGGLITATSANRAGEPPPRSPDQLTLELADAVRLVIDAGLSSGGMPSTVVAARGDEVVVLRQGRVTVRALTRVLGREPRVEDAS